LVAGGPKRAPPGAVTKIVQDFDMSLSITVVARCALAMAEIFRDSNGTMTVLRSALKPASAQAS
jgi:hypothetical protein